MRRTIPTNCKQRIPPKRYDSFVFITAKTDHRIIGLTVQGDGNRKTMATAECTVRQANADLTRLRFTPAVDIPVNSPTDERKCNLSSMLHIAGSRLLLADLNNQTVKLVDMQTRYLVSNISVQGPPWDMCHLPGERVAVTMARNGIQFLETGGQLALGDRIELDGDCRVVGEGSTASIYVSDMRRNKITKLDMNLHIIKTFQDPALKEPRSITALGDQLLICGYGSNTIMTLNLSTGQMTQLMGEKEGIRDPMFALYCPQQCKLLVTEHLPNKIKVFNTIE
ncbi:hypothetical protein MAR_006812 [Mya arenaria]|uniref:Uncharacterized protein n=1 Tax=Mya arenaria TaxID=6604 RepID=A0ABY7DCM4_MYAAR|nr:hypothetical protein MAR_006812 [Mya arenaria]